MKHLDQSQIKHLDHSTNNIPIQHLSFIHLHFDDTIYGLNNCFRPQFIQCDIIKCTYCWELYWHYINNSIIKIFQKFIFIFNQLDHFCFLFCEEIFVLSLIISIF
eukprot:45231_1